MLEKLKADGLETGGYTGNQEGFKYLHDHETVLNKDDSKKVLSAVQFARDMFKFNVPTLNGNQLAGVGDTYNLNLHIDSFSGSQKDANNLSKTILDNLKKFGK